MKLPQTYDKKVRNFQFEKYTLQLVEQGIYIYIPYRIMDISMLADRGLFLLCAYFYYTLFNSL